MIHIRDFYLACCHKKYSNLFAVGFARPIIGNIPSMSEMQARVVANLLAKKIDRPNDIEELHKKNQTCNDRAFSKINQDIIYPVEMFPYCNNIANWLDRVPNRRSLGSCSQWWRAQLTPATTMHYWFDDDVAKRVYQASPVYMPTFLIALLMMIKPMDLFYRGILGIRSRFVRNHHG